ncbi:DUF2163 domain-containing protein [Paracoccaceae bacterium Fryx2]|nr:DUF2163 domain-containing protein [Paracoccaceae bacterium Fryx2]
MKSLPPALQAHLDEGTTTLAWCWRIVLADGVTLGFTDHDRNVTFDGTDFEPESGFAASEVRSGSDLSVDAQDAQGVLTSDRITETDIRKGSGGATVAENLNALPDQPDIVVTLDRLQAIASPVESVSLVVAWFGNDLRAGSCKVKPGVEVATKATTPANWSVNGVSRASAHLVSRDAEDRPVYGGTPADFAVVQAIQEMKARGLRVTFYPFLLMDVPPGNTLPNPYSANAATPGQPAFPWRGRITCSPAAGFAGSVDKTGTAATQVSALFGAATPGNFRAPRFFLVLRCSGLVWRPEGCGKRLAVVFGGVVGGHSARLWRAAASSA